MVSPGFYSILLKWGLDSLTKIIGTHNEREVSVLLEAIKTRNSLVLKRFEYAWEASQNLTKLLDEVEERIQHAKNETAKSIENSNNKISAENKLKRFCMVMEEGHHASLYRKLRRIRGRFEATNDLFSAYSTEFSDYLRFDNFKILIDKSSIKNTGEAIRLYRQLWIFYCDIMHTLVRVSSSDLRFWLTDGSYFIEALEIAGTDRSKFESHLISKTDDVWLLSVENPETVEAFWNKVESQTTNT